MVAVALLVGGIALLTWAVWTGRIPTSSRVPAYARPSALEAAYKPQIDRLVQLALDPDLRRFHATNRPADVRLFAAPEILEGKLETSRRSWRMVTNRSHDYWTRRSLLAASPGVGRAVANRYWDVMPDGRRVEVVEYQLRVIDRSGEEIGVILAFDLERLEAAAQESSP